ncbi:MAG TPA: hypothetical protein VM580_06260, partial [Labilithrix sp.]|nr:hypothetical protein [Labilithrix sp.]
MSSRLWLAFVVGAGCSPSDEPPIIEIETIAAMPVSLVVPAEPIPGEALSYRWDIYSAPPTSRAAPPPPGAVTSFTADKRGEYVIDRWVILGG